MIPPNDPGDPPALAASTATPATKPAKKKPLANAKKPKKKKCP